MLDKDQVSKISSASLILCPTSDIDEPRCPFAESETPSTPSPMHFHLKSYPPQPPCWLFTKKLGPLIGYDRSQRKNTETVERGSSRVRVEFVTNQKSV